MMSPGRVHYSFAWTIVLASVSPALVRGANEVITSVSSGDVGRAAVGIKELDVSPDGILQPLLDSSTKEEEDVRTATAGYAQEEDVRGGSGGSSSETVRRSVENEEEKEASLKQMVLNKAKDIQGRSTPRTGPLYCDEFISTKDFYIHSPSYPENYPNKYRIYRRHPDYCGVVFTVLRLDLATRPDPAQEVIRDVGGSVGVEGRRECSGDTLLINGVTHCGRYQRGKTATFLFPSSLMTLEFRSRKGHGASGFLLQGRQVRTCRQPRTLGQPLVSTVPCDKRVEGERFLVQSPGYPDQYDHNLECRYTVVRHDANVCGVQLMVESFSLENGTCMFDYLEVQGQRLCGALPPAFTRYHRFEGNELDIRFRTDESVKSEGFSIVGQQLPCDESLPRQSPLSQSPPGRIGDDQSFSLTEENEQSPSTPMPLETPRFTESQPDIDINYILSLIGRQPLPTEEEEEEEETTITSTTMSGELESEEEMLFTGSTESEEDFTEVDPGLVVTDDGTKADQNVNGDPDFNPFTGTGLPPTFPTTVDFPATGTFPITTSFPTRNGCDQNLVGTSIDVTSPGYPTSYPANQDCTYTVGRSSETVCKLKVNFLDVSLPSRDAITGECNADYLTLGGVKYCGEFQNQEVDVSFPLQVLSFTFHSDESFSGRGFMLRLTQETTNCGGTSGDCDSIRQEENFLLTSPSYPLRYPPSTDCTTTVVRSSQNVVSLVLELVDFEMATTAGCSGDYLEVAGQRLCGQLSGSTRSFSFLNNLTTIKFHSDADNSQGRGYKIRVRQSTSLVPESCGGFVTTPSASIQSPGYPASYPPNIDCRFIVTKTSSDVCQLQLRVLDMDVEVSPGCGRDYLQVGMQERLCGQRRPGEIRKYHFTDYQLDLFFHSDGLGSGRGFSVEVTQLACGHFKPVYPTYRPQHHHHQHHHHRPGFYKPVKPFLKTHFNPLWKIKHFFRPWRNSHRHSSHYTSSQTSGPHYGPPSTDYGPPSTDYGLPSTDYGPPITDYGHPSTDYGLPSTDYGLPITDYGPPSAGYLPPTPDCTTSSNYLPPAITTPRPTFPPPTTLPPVTETTTFPTLPTVTPVFSPEFFPTPIPELLFSPPSSTGDLNVTAIPNAVQVNNSKGQREPRMTEGSCHNVVTGQRFTIQSPGYPGPYYTSMSCRYAIERRDADVCGVEMIMDQFDVEETPGCAEARLVLAQRQYCGSIAPGSRSVVPFPLEGPIIMEFVSGRFRSGAGFSLRGRQIPCVEGTLLATAAPSGEKRPWLARQEPARGRKEDSSPPSEDASMSLRLSEEAEWLDEWTGEGDIGHHWAVPGGHGLPTPDRRGWKPLLDGRS